MPLRKTLELRHGWSLEPSGRFQAEGSSFESLAEEFRRPLLGFLFRIVNDVHLAEELAQETFLNVYRSRRVLAVEAFTIAIYRVAIAIGLRRKQRTGTEHGRDEPQAAIRRSIEELPEGERLAVLLHKYQGLNYAQIAAVLSVNETEAKSLLLRAFAQLQSKLSGVIKRSTE